MLWTECVFNGTCMIKWGGMHGFKYNMFVSTSCQNSVYYSLDIYHSKVARDIAHHENILARIHHAATVCIEHIYIYIYTHGIYTHIEDVHDAWPVDLHRPCPGLLADEASPMDVLPL